MSDGNKKSPGERPKGTEGKKPAKTGKSPTSGSRAGDEPAFNTVLESEQREKAKSESQPKKAKSGISRSSALFMSLLAAVAGGAIGWGGPMFFSGQSEKNEAVQAALEQTRSELAAAQAEQKKLADALSAIQGTSRNQASSNQSIAASLASLEDDIQKLQETQTADQSEALTELQERVSKLATLTLPVDEGNEDGVASGDILSLVNRIESIEIVDIGDVASRLDALETQMNELSVKPVTFPEPDTTPIELPPEEAPQSAADTLNVLIDTFPRTKMLQAVEAQKEQAAKKPSWLQRALSRHVKTHDEDIIDPVETINAAQAALEGGNVSDALNLMGELNPPVRAVAAEWMGAAKKATKLIEKDL